MIKKPGKNDREKELEKAPATDPEKGREEYYYYKICPRCGAMAHIDNLHCPKCGRRLKEPGGIETVHKTGTDPGLSRSNLDHPEGCPDCKGGCRYCFSFGVKKPHPKAHCDHCERDMKVCCLKARKLPVLLDLLPDLGLPIAKVLESRPANADLFDEFEKMLTEKISECRSHVEEAEFAFEKAMAGGRKYA